ncbi:MAG TPA: hypothetical protein VK131_05720 [Candidatus Acidoferrales bacterium]|nr:hypothetical protein [Candidatus Acidoferrales bacterium]
MVGHRLGLELLDADLSADAEGGRGHTHFAPPGSWFQPRRGSLRPAEKDFIERVLTAFMAGYFAAARAGHVDREGSGYDLDQAIREWVRYLTDSPAERMGLLDEFARRAAELVEKPENWRAIELVAGELLRKERLEGAEALRLVDSNDPPQRGGNRG